MAPHSWMVKGKFLIPGLWDMHSHHQGTGRFAGPFFGKRNVGTRDMGGDADFILTLRERVRSGAAFLVRRLSVRDRCSTTLRQYVSVPFTTTLREMSFSPLPMRRLEMACVLQAMCP